MSNAKKLFKDASSIVTDSGINTCYYTPQARKNRIPSYFEQLEPRQLLSGTQVNPEDTVAQAPVVAETFATPLANPLENIGNLGELLKQAAMPDFSSLDLSSVLQSIPGMQDLDLANLDISSIGEEFLKHLPTAGIVTDEIKGDFNLGKSFGVWLSLWSDTVTVSGNFFSNDNYDQNSVLIMASGDVVLENVNFNSIESIVIRAKSVTFGSGADKQTISIEGGEITISALDYIKFSSNTTVTGDGNMTLAASETVTVADGAKINTGGNVSMNAVEITMGKATIDIGGNFTAHASTEAHVHPLLGPLPVKIAQGEARIEINGTIISANNVSITAEVATATTKELPSLGELTNNQYLAIIDSFLTTSAADIFKTYLGIDLQQVKDPISGLSKLQFMPGQLGQANEYLEKLSTPLSETLNELYKGLEISAPVLITYGSATSEVVVNNATITAKGDVTITAKSTVANDQTKNADLFGFVLSIDQANADVAITGNTKITAQRDAIIGAVSENTNTVTLKATYNASSDPSSKPPLFSANKAQQGGGQTPGGATTQRKKETYAMAIAIGINEAQASVMLGANVTINAGRDIVITSNTTENLNLSAAANATAAGNLAIGLALNFGAAKSYTTINATLNASGSVKATSTVDSKVTTASTTNIPAPAPAGQAPAQTETETPQGAEAAIKGVSEQVSKKITDLVLALMPMGFATTKLQEAKMGLGIALGFAKHDAVAETVIGSNAVITAAGKVSSGPVTEGRGAVILNAVSNTTPVINVSASATIDPVSQPGTTPPTQSQTNPPVTADPDPDPAPGETYKPAVVEKLTEVGVITSKEAHGLKEGDKVKYTCTDPTKAIPGLKNGEIYTVVVYNDELNQFALLTADGSHVQHFHGANKEVSYDPKTHGATAWKDATHTFTKVGTEGAPAADNGVVSVTQDAAHVKAQNIKNGEVLCEGHNFKVGDIVVYSAANPAGGLTHGTQYKIYEVAGGKFTLADMNGNRIYIDKPTAANSQHKFTKFVPQVDANKVTAVEGDIAGGQVNVNNAFKVGDIVTYTCSDPDDAMRGLTSGQKYTIAAAGTDYFTLKGTDGQVITLGKNGTHNTVHTFTKTAPETTGSRVVVPGANIDANNKFKAPNIPFKTGDKVTYTVSAGGTALGGLVVGKEYTIKAVDATAGYFQLADENGNLVNVTNTGAAGTSDHIFTLKANTAAQKDKGVSIAAGVTVFTNTANVLVKSGATIVHNTLVEITSDANYKLPANERKLVPGTNILNKASGVAASIPLDFLKEATGFVEDLATSIDDLYLDAQQQLGSLFGVDAINFEKSDSNFFVPNSYVYAMTAGAKESSTAASVAYIGQDNVSTAVVEDGVSIVRTGGVKDAAVDATNDTVTLDNEYKGYEGYVTYEVSDGSSALSGLQAGATYWGKVGQDGKLSLYDATNKTAKIDLGKSNSAAEHYFLFQQQPVGSGTSENIDVTYTENDSPILTLNDAHGFSTGDIVSVGKGLGLNPDSLYMVFVQSATELSFKEIKNGAVSSEYAKLTVSDEEGYSVILATDAQKKEAGLSFSMTTGEYKKDNAVTHNPFAGFKNGDTITYTAKDGKALTGLTDGKDYTLILMGGGTFALKDGNTLVTISMNNGALGVSHTFSKADAKVSFNGSDLSFGTDVKNPVATVAITGQSIAASSDAARALRSGDIVTYTSTSPINGLENGKQYVVTVLADGSFALRAYENGNATGDFISMDRLCQGVASDATHTFALTEPKANAPLEVAKDGQVSDENALFIGAHDFQTGDTVELAGLATNAQGSVQLNADQTPIYNTVGTFTVVRLSDTSVKLLDAAGNAYSVPTGTSNGLDDYKLTKVASGSMLVADTNNGNALTVIENTFTAGDAVVYRAEGGSAASGLVNGTTYYIESVTEMGDGTAVITLSATKGGSAITVTLTDAAHMLSLTEGRVYTGTAENGGVKTGNTTGIYKGAEVVFNGIGTVKLADGSTSPLVRGATLFAQTDENGVLRLASTQEDFLAGNFLDITSFDGTLTIVGESHTFNQNTVALGEYMLESTEPHGLIDGSVVTIERNGEVECYTVTTYGEYNFTLTDLESGLIASRDFLFASDAEISLNRPVASIHFTAETIVDQPLYVAKPDHGFVTGQALNHVKTADGAVQGTYYVIVRDANTFYLANTLEDALNGNARSEELKIASGAQGDYVLKQKPQEYGIFVQAKSSDKTVNLTGKMGTGKGSIITTTATTSQKPASSSEKISKAIRDKVSPQRKPNSSSGAGGAVQILNLQHTTTAKLGTENNTQDTLILGHGLSVTATTDNGVVSMVQAGSSGQLKGISGTSGVLYLNNTTTAELGVGKARVVLGDALGADGKNSLFIEAKDSSIYTQLSAAMSSGETAMGGTVFVQVVDRDTNAYLLGNENLGGSVSVLGYAEVNALNTGRGVAILIGGSHASPAQQQAATNTGTGQTGQQPGQQPGGSTQQQLSGIPNALSSLQTVNDAIKSVLPLGTDDDKNLTEEEKKKRAEQKKDGNYLSLLTGSAEKAGTIGSALSSGLGQVNSNVGSLAQGTNSSGTPQQQQPQDKGPSVNEAYTGEIFVGYSSEETKAVVRNLSNLVVAGFVARALNDTKQITAAGALALTTSSTTKTPGTPGTPGQGGQPGTPGTPSTSTKNESSADSKAGAGSVVVTITDRDTEASIDNVATIRALKGDVKVDAKDDGFVIAVGAGLAGSTAGSGYGGTVLVNARLSDVKAYVANSDLTVEQGSLTIDAIQDVKMITVAGGGGFGDAKGVGLSLGVNVLAGDTTAYLKNGNITVAQDVAVTATSGTGTGRNGIDLGDNPEESVSGIDSIDGGYNLIAIGASAGVGLGGNSLGGTLVTNIVTSETTAYIGDDVNQTTILADGSVSVLAADNFGILSIGGSLGVSGKAKQDPNNTNQDANGQKSTSVGAVLAVNVIHSTSNAYARNITIGKNTASKDGADISVTSLSKQQILSIAGAAAAAKGDAIAITLAANVIAAGAAASLHNAKIEGKTLAVKSGNESSILSIAGGVGLSTGNNKAAAIAANVIAGVDVPALGPDSDPKEFENLKGKGTGNLDVTASVSDSSITLHGDSKDCMQVLAETSSAILSIAAGISASTGSEEGASTKTNLAGSATINVIARNVSATVTDTDILAAGKTSIIARDYIMKGGEAHGSRILAISGQVGASKGKQAGAALGVNVIANNVNAGLVNSDLTQTGANGGLDVLADSIAEILSITGSVAVSINTGGDASAKSASIAVNVIDKDVTATLSGAKTAGKTKVVKGPISIRATDSSQILGIAATVALAFGGNNASALGGTLAVNVVNTSQKVNVLNARVNTQGSISIKAEGQNSIHAINLGIAGSGLVANPNVIVNDTAVSIVNSSLIATGDIDVAAWQSAAGTTITEAWTKKFTDEDATLTEYLGTAGIDFSTNILSVNLNVAANIGGSNSSIGGAVAVNVVASTAKALVEKSILDAGGDVTIDAVNSSVIRAVAMGASVSVNDKAAISGGIASNTITGGAYANVDFSSLKAGKDVTVSALNNADILSLAINAAVSTGGTSVGLYLGVNVITADAIASIYGDHATAPGFKSGGNFTVAAQDTSKIWALTVAAAVGGKTAVGLANNTSVIVGTVEASITGLIDNSGNITHKLSSLDVGGNLTVSALSSTQILNIAIGAAVGMGSGAAVQATASENVISRSVNAGLIGITDVLVGGNLVVSGYEAQPALIGDWRNASYMKGTGITDVDTSDFAATSDNGLGDTGVGVADGGTHSVDPNKALFNPESGIFSLVVSVAASAGGSASVSGALNFNWLEREVNAIVSNVDAIKFTKSGSMSVTAQSAAAAFGGVLSVGAGTGSAAVGAAAAINVLNNKTKAIMENCTAGGWTNGAWDTAKLKNVTVKAENTSGAVGMAVGVGATSGTAGVGASMTLNLGMSKGKPGFTSSTAEKRKDELSGIADQYYTDLLTNGSGSYTSDTSELGGESAEAGLNNVALHSSGALVVEALQNSAFMSVDLAVGAGSTAGVAGAIALNLLSVNSAAYIKNPVGKTVTAGSATVNAETGGKAWAFLIGVGAAGTVGATGLVSVSRVGGTAQAYTDGGTIKTLSGGLTVSAYGKTDMLTVGIAIGAGGTVGASGSVVIAFAGNTVTADVNNTVLNLKGNLTATAVNTTSVITTALGVAGAGTAAGAGAVAINLATWGEAASYDPANSNSQATSSSDGALEFIGSKQHSGGFETRAQVTSADIKAADITIKANNKSSYVAALLLVAGSGTASGAGGLVFNLMDSASTAALNVTGKVIASGAVSVASENTTKLWATMASIAGSGTAAGAGSLALNLSNISSVAKIAGAANSSLDAGSVSVYSKSEADLYALALSVAASGIAAGAASIALNASTNPTTASIAGSGSSFVLTVKDGGKVNVQSVNNTVQVAGTIGVAASLKAAGGASISINVASKGEITDIAKKVRETESGKNLLKTSDGKDIAENTSFIGTIRNGKLYLASESGKAQYLKTNGVTNETHYLVLTDDNGNETLYSFTLADVQADGSISAANLVNVETGAKGLASIPKDSGFSYRSNKYGAPTYTSDAVNEVASSTATVDGVTIIGNDKGNGKTGNVGLAVNASSSRTTVSVAAGVSASGGASGYGSVNVAVANNLTQAIVQNSVLVLGTGDLSIKADNKGSSYGVGLAVSGALYAAGSAVVSVGVDSGHTKAQLLNSTVTSAKNVTVDATTTLTAFNVNVAMAGAIGAGAATVATTVIQGGTIAEISGGSITASGAVTAYAKLGKPTGVVDLANIASGKTELDGTLATASKEYKAAEAEANSSDAKTNENDAEKDRTVKNSLSATGILSVSVSASGGGLAASGAMAVNRFTGDVKTVVSNTTIEANTFAAKSEMASSIQSYVASAAVGLVGLSGSIGINMISGKTYTEVTNVDLTTAKSASVTANQNLVITGLTGTVSAASMAGGFGMIINTLSGDVSAIIRGGSVKAASGLTLDATRTSKINAYAIGVSLGMGGAFSGGVAINSLKGSTIAGLTGDTATRLTISDSGAIRVNAFESTTSTTLGVQAAAGLGLGIASGVAVTTATGNVKAYVDKADFSNVVSLTVKASTYADLAIKGIGAAIGGVAAGIVVSDISLTNNIVAAITNATFTDVKKVEVLGVGDWNLYAFSLAGAAGIIAGSAAVAGVHLESAVDAYIADSVFTNVDTVSISAIGTPKARALCVAPSVSVLASLGVAVATADVAPTLNAYAKGLTTDAAKPANMNIKAELKTDGDKASAEAKAFALGLGGLAGVGGGVATASNNAKVHAYLTDTDATKKLHFASLDIQAVNNAILSSLCTGVGAGVAAGVGSTVSELKSNTETLAYVAAPGLIAVSGALNVLAESRLRTKQESYAGAGALFGAAAATVAEQDLSTRTQAALGRNLSTKTDIGGTITAKDTTVQALNYIDANQYTNSIVGSLINGSGTVASVEMDLMTEVLAGAGVTVSAEALNFHSLNDIVRGVNGKDGMEATSVGLIAVQAGKSHTDITAISRVNVGKNATLKITGASTKNVDGVSGGNRMLLQAFNKMNVKCDIGFTAGGAIGVPVIGGIIETDLTAEVVVNTGARLESSTPLGGDIILHAGSTEKVDMDVATSVYALASAGTLQSWLNAKTVNRVAILGNASIYSSGDLAMAAGKMGYKYKTTENAGIGDVDFYVSGDIYDNTAIPASRVTDSGLDWNRSNTVSTATQTDLQSRGDTEIYAQIGSYAFASHLYAHNWVSSIGGPVKENFSRIKVWENEKVSIDGKITAGVDNELDATVYKLTRELWNEYQNNPLLSATEKARIELALANFTKLFTELDLSSSITDYFDFLELSDSALEKLYGEWTQKLATELSKLTLSNGWQEFYSAVTSNPGEYSIDEMLAVNLLEYMRQNGKSFNFAQFKNINNLGNSMQFKNYVETLVTTQAMKDIMNKVDFDKLSASYWEEVQVANEAIAQLLAAVAKLRTGNYVFDVLSNTEQDMLFAFMQTISPNLKVDDIKNFGRKSDGEMDETARKSKWENTYLSKLPTLLMNANDLEAIIKAESLGALREATTGVLTDTLAKDASKLTQAGWKQVKALGGKLTEEQTKAFAALESSDVKYDYSKLTSEQQATLRALVQKVMKASGTTSANWTAWYTTTEAQKAAIETLAIVERVDTALKQKTTRFDEFSTNMLWAHISGQYNTLPDVLKSSLTEQQKLITQLRMRAGSNELADIQQYAVALEASLLTAYIQKDVIARTGDQNFANALQSLSYMVVGHNSGMLSHSFAPAAVENILVKEYLDLKSILYTYSAETTAGKQISSRIKELETKLVNAGLGQFNKDASGKDVFELTTGTVQDMLRLSDVYINRGNVRIYTTHLEGSGTVEAKGDSSLEITVDSKAGIGLMVDNLRVNSAEGGKVRLFNKSGSINFTEGTSASPHLTVKQKSEGAALVAGYLENLAGKITLHSQGDLMVVKDVNAASMDLFSAGTLTVALSGSEAFYNVGGIPLEVKDGSYDKREIVYNDGSGSLTALGDIRITATYINVNGTIQSGAAKWELVLTDSMATEGNSGLTEVTGGSSTGSIGYTYKDGTFVVDALRARSGNIYLKGIILNTNGGAGKVIVHTNPDIIIDNKTGHDLVINGLDTGSTTPGQVYIWDTGKGDSGYTAQFTTNSPTASVTYKPSSNYTYYYLTANVTGKESYYKHENKSLFGIDAFYPDSYASHFVSSKILNDAPLQGAGYIAKTIAGQSIIDSITKENGYVKDTVRSKEFGNSSVTGTEYSYTRRLDQEIRKEEHTKTTWYLFVRYSNTTYETWVTDTNQNVRWYAIDSDKDISISRSQGNGNITVTSGGTVTLDGNVTAEKNISITSKNGDITDADESWINSRNGTITLKAAGNTGSEDHRILVISRDNTTVSVTAGKDMYLQSSANLKVSATAGNKADIVAAGSLNGTIKAPNIVLAAGMGIGSKATPLQVSASSSDVTISASALDGDIYIAAKGSSLSVGQITAPGLVSLNTTESILDANAAEETDERDISRREAQWGKLGILESEGSDADRLAQINGKLQTICDQLTGSYHNYWTIQNKLESPDYSREAEIAAYMADGYTQEQAEAFLQRRDEQMEVWRADLAAFDATLLASYDANWQADVKDLSAGQRALLLTKLSGSLWTREQLLSEITNALYNGTTTTLVIEEANIIAKNVDLYAGKDIGNYQQAGSYTVANYAQKLAGLEAFTRDDLLHLWSSEAPDRDFVGDDCIISLSDDVNVLLTGGSVSAYANGNLLLGTGVSKLGAQEMVDLTVSTLRAENSELRVKADGNLFTTKDGDGLNAGTYLVAEASNGDLGQKDNPLNIGDHDLLRLRAYGNIYVKSSEDINLDGINKEKDKEAHISGKNITVTNDLVIVPENTFLNADINVTLNGKNSVETRDTSEITAGNDFIVKGEKVTINGASQAENNTTVTGSNITVLGDATLEYGNMEMVLPNYGPGTQNSLVIDDDATFIQKGSDPTTPPVVSVTGQGANDLIDMSGSQLAGIWNISGQNSGSLERDGLKLEFTDIQNIIAGNADDTLNLAGGSINTADMGDGYNTINNTSGQSMNWELNGVNRLIVSSAGKTVVGTLLGASEIVGSTRGDSLTYNDNAGTPGHWIVESKNDNGGTLNDLRFNNITTSTNNTPGGTYDLYARMDNINLNAAPFTLTIYPGGYFYNLKFAKGVTIIDLRPRNPFVPNEEVLEEDRVSSDLLALLNTRDSLNQQTLEINQASVAEYLAKLQASSNRDSAPTELETEGGPEDGETRPDAIVPIGDDSSSNANENKKKEEAENSEAASEATSEATENGEKKPEKEEKKQGEKAEPEAKQV